MISSELNTFLPLEIAFSDIAIGIGVIVSCD